jgi:hypothetical protein
MSAEAKARKQAAQLAVLDRGITVAGNVAVQLLKSPAVTLPLGVAITEYMARNRAINDTERGLIIALMISAGFLEAFKPIAIGGSS